MLLTLYNIIFLIVKFSAMLIGIYSFDNCSSSWHLHCAHDKNYDITKTNLSSIELPPNNILYTLIRWLSKSVTYRCSHLDMSQPTHTIYCIEGLDISFNITFTYLYHHIFLIALYIYIYISHSIANQMNVTNCIYQPHQ